MLRTAKSALTPQARRMPGRTARLLACVAMPVAAMAPAADRPFVSPLTGDAVLLADDVAVPSGARQAVVPVRLKSPLRRPVRFRYLTRNGSAQEGVQFRRTAGHVLFLPGETEKRVRIPLLRPLGTRTFELTLGWPAFHPPFRGDVATIRGEGKAALAPPVPPPDYPAARCTSGRRLVFQSRFLEPVRRHNRAGEWRSAFSWGKVQTANRELAPYTDRPTDGTRPHPIVDGHRRLQAERRDVMVDGKRYRYSTAMLSSRGMTPGWRYGYFEIRLKLPRAQGTTPAVWMLPDKDAVWPPEIDILEMFQRDARPALTSSIHWRDPDSGQKQHEGVELPFDRPFDWHVIGFDWTPQWMVTLVDGREIVRRPNIFHRPMTIIIGMAVGGLTAAPRDPTIFPVSMELDYLRVWQSPAEAARP